MALYLLLGFFVSTASFSVAVRKKKGPWRSFLTIFHIASITAPLILQSKTCHSLFTRISVPFAVYSTLHTTAVLTREHYVPHGSQGFPTEQAALYGIWANVRHIPPPYIHDTKEESVWTSDLFARVGKIVILYTIEFVSQYAISSMYASLRINVYHFSPEHRSLLPLPSMDALYLRGLVSIQWIWSAYVILDSAHKIFSIIFIYVLGWSKPTEWPPLFGHVSDATSLQRFWAKFWHSLHLRPFLAYMPRRLHRSKSLAALWIFTLSAVCHAVVNWVVMGSLNARAEFQFFFLNYIACLGEAIWKKALKSRGLCVPDNRLIQALGYVWVYLFFFVTVPAWQYVLIESMVLSK